MYLNTPKTALYDKSAGDRSLHPLNREYTSSRGLRRARTSPRGPKPGQTAPGDDLRRHQWPTGLHRDSKAQAEQVRSVAVERIGRRVGHLPAPLMADLDQALRIHLNL
jgi:hypothetical protein